MYHSFTSLEHQYSNTNTQTPTGTALKSLSLKAQEHAVGQAKYSRELQREHEVQTRQLRLDLADARRALSDIRISSMRATDTKRTCNEEDIIDNTTEEMMAIEELIDHSNVVEELPILPSGQNLLSSSSSRPRSSSSSSSSSDSKKQSISSSKNTNQGELKMMNNLMTKIENEEKSLKRTTEEIDQLIERVKLDSSVIYDESEEKLSMHMLNPSDSAPSSVSPTHDSKISSSSTTNRRRHHHHRRRDTKEFREKMHALRYKLRAHGYVRSCFQSSITQQHVQPKHIQFKYSVVRTV